MFGGGGEGGIMKGIASKAPSETDGEGKEARGERAREREEGGILRRKENGRRENTAKH